MLYVSKKNESYVIVEGEMDELYTLSEHFSVKLPNYRHMPAYKRSKGAWDGSIKIFNIRTGELPYGLIGQLKKCAQKHSIEIKFDKNVFNINSITKEDIDDLLDRHNLPEKFERREYQYAGALAAINYKRLMIESPTASGKSFLAYIICLWILENTNDRIGIVVPTQSLVEQMYGDFEEYGLDVDKFCARIYTKYENKYPNKRIIITTWQSIYNMDEQYFHQFGVILGDEAHGFKAKSLSHIMNNCINSEYRIGLTGTVPEKKSERFRIEGHFGPKIVIAETDELIKEGYLNDIEPINVQILKYTDEEKKAVFGLKYQDEIEYILGIQKRNDYISKLANSCKGNTLVLFNRVEAHGKPLYELIKNNTDKKVFFVSGEVDTSDREIIRKIVKNETNCIIVASMGTFSTGINIPTLDNLILAHPTKAREKLLQMIGRVLRKSELITKVFDLVDDFTWDGKKNYAIEHSIERLKIYKSKNFQIRYEEIKI